jgi:outer membrane protein assembly factor BamA
LILGAQVVTEPGSAPDRVRVILVAQDAMQRWFPAFTVTYLPGEGSILLLQVTTPNFRREGIRMRASSWLSSQRRLFDFSLGLPALLHPLDNTSFELHNRDRSWPGVRAKSQGVSLGYGRALDRRRRFSAFAKLGIDRWELSTAESFDLRRSDGTNWRLGTALSASFDNRDSALLGTKGSRLSLSLDFAPAFGGVLLGRTGWGISMQRLQRLPFGLRGRVKAGMRGLIGEHHPQDRLYAGGPGTLRGFFSYAVSPVSGGVDSRPIGGDRLARASAELGYGLNSVLEPFLFVDAANAFHPDQPWFSQPSSPRPLRYGLAWSWGFGLLLRLPVLPFRFEWGRPITRGPRDPEMLFSLGIGTG